MLLKISLILRFESRSFIVSVKTRKKMKTGRKQLTMKKERSFSNA